MSFKLYATDPNDKLLVEGVIFETRPEIRAWLESLRERKLLHSSTQPGETTAPANHTFTNGQLRKL